MSYSIARRRNTNSDANRLLQEDRPVHEWYRFVLSFPPHLVRQYLERFGLQPGHVVLDPFCGTGTTVVECKKLGINGIGVEGNPMAHFAGCVKTDWSVNPTALLIEARQVAQSAYAELAMLNIQDEVALSQIDVDPDSFRSLSFEQTDLMLKNSISPLPLHKSLVVREIIQKQAKPEVRRHLLLALAKTIVNNGSNLHFGPEVGLGKIKDDAAIIAPWLDNVHGMARDIREFKPKQGVQSMIHLGDERNVELLLADNLLDAVITSPPYPNEKDYTRTTGLESVFLDFIQSKADLRALKKGLVRSNTRGVYKDDTDIYGSKTCQEFNN